MLSANYDELAMELVAGQVDSLVQNVASQLTDHMRNNLPSDELERIASDTPSLRLDDAEPVYRLALAYARVAVFKAMIG